MRVNTPKPAKLRMRFLLAALLCLALASPACHAQQTPVGVSPNSQPKAADEPGYWAFDPPTDTFSPSALLDLRYLNEKTAGETGFVRRTPDGGGFALGNG